MPKRFKRVYIEITNVCNLSCSFCPGTKRPPRFLSVAEFSEIVGKVAPYTDYIYLHVMGEPLLHPDLSAFLKIAGNAGLSVNLTTNGTLVKERKADLLAAPALRKVSISLHSFEGNGGGDVTGYLSEVCDFAESTDAIVSLRLWNAGGADRRNGEITEYLSDRFGVDIASLEEKNGSRKIREKLYLESAEKFDWPSLDEKERAVVFCHGLSQQIGVLSDGTVVPCCLDSEGSVRLGNLFEEMLEDILQSERTQAFLRGMAAHAPSEELCRRCGYATRFTK